MQILFLIFAIVAVVLGFVGLVMILKGLVDKSSKSVWLGTVLVCVMLVLGLMGAFYVSKRVLNTKRLYQKEQQMIKDKLKKERDLGIMRKNCLADSTFVVEATEVRK